MTTTPAGPALIKIVCKDKPEWLHKRDDFAATASDAYTLLTKPLLHYARKKKLVDGPEQNERMTWGLRLQNEIARGFAEDTGRTVELAETVSFRNTDSQNAVVLRSVNYYGSDGKRLRSYLAQPIEVGPFATADFVVTRTDISGGTGANFVINWGATTEVSPPIVEAIMISCGPSRNLSFVSRGLVLDKAIADDNSRVDQNPAAATPTISPTADTKSAGEK